MSYRVTHWTDEMERDFPIHRFEELLDELSKADREHPDVAVTHDSEWSRSVYKSGVVLLQHLEGDEVFQRGSLGRHAVIDLMKAVAEGRIDDARGTIETFG